MFRTTRASAWCLVGDNLLRPKPLYFVYGCQSYFKTHLNHDGLSAEVIITPHQTIWNSFSVFLGSRGELILPASVVFDRFVKASRSHVYMWSMVKSGDFSSDSPNPSACPWSSSRPAWRETRIETRLDDSHVLTKVIANFWDHGF